MITDALLALGLSAVTWIVSFLPESAGFPTDVFTAFAFLGNAVKALNGIFPLSTLGTIIGLVIGVDLAILGLRWFRSLLSHVPFIGGAH